jgi:hypothetical protein
MPVPLEAPRWGTFIESSWDTDLNQAQILAYRLDTYDALRVCFQDYMANQMPMDQLDPSTHAIVEVGSGVGHLSAMMNPEYERFTTHTDLYPRNIDRLVGMRPYAYALPADVTRLTEVIPARSVQHVVAVAALDVLTDDQLEQAAAQMHRAIRPGGKVHLIQDLTPDPVPLVKKYATEGIIALPGKIARSGDSFILVKPSDKQADYVLRKARELYRKTPMMVDYIVDIYDHVIQDPVMAGQSLFAHNAAYLDSFVNFLKLAKLGKQTENIVDLHKLRMAAALKRAGFKQPMVDYYRRAVVAPRGMSHTKLATNNASQLANNFKLDVGNAAPPIYDKSVAKQYRNQDVVKEEARIQVLFAER